MMIIIIIDVWRFYGVESAPTVALIPKTNKQTRKTWRIYHFVVMATALGTCDSLIVSMMRVCTININQSGSLLA